VWGSKHVERGHGSMHAAARAIRESAIPIVKGSDGDCPCLWYMKVQDHTAL
jgi:hypothetical protein